MQKKKNNQLALPDNPSYFGKTPPNAKELEEAVLGALLVDNNVITVLVDILPEESFYDERHKVVYRAMLRLFEKSNPIDLLTVSQELRQMGSLETIGGTFYLTELANRVASAANVEHHSRIMLQKWALRETINFATEATKDAFDDTQDCFELMERIALFGEKMTSKLSINADEAVSMDEALERRLNDNTPLDYFPMFIDNLAEIWTGIFPRDYVLFTARPKAGKTSFALQLLYNLGKRGVKTAYINLDTMTTGELIDRILQQQTHANGQNLRLNKLTAQDKQEILDLKESVVSEDIPIYFVEQSDNSMVAVKKQMETMINNGVRFFIIDYIQLIKSPAKTERDSLEEVSAMLKKLIKKHNITLFVLGQLNRSGNELSGGDNPLRDCTTHVNCAPAMDNEEEFRDSEIGNTGNDAKDYTLFDVKRQRYGASGKTYVRFNGNKQLFIDSNIIYY